ADRMSSPCATSHARLRPTTCASSTCASMGTSPARASACRRVMASFIGWSCCPEGPVHTTGQWHEARCSVPPPARRLGLAPPKRRLEYVPVCGDGACSTCPRAAGIRREHAHFAVVERGESFVGQARLLQHALRGEV